MTTLIFIHGIAVTESMYDGTFELIKQQLAVYCPDIKVSPCFWGGLGMKLNANWASIPTSTPNSNVIPVLAEEELTEEARQISRWEQLYVDPLFELGLLSVREPSEESEVNSNDSNDLYSLLDDLQIEPELQAKLEEAGIAEVFAQAVQTVINSNPYKEALQKVSELSSEYYGAVARAIVAQAMFDCSKQDKYAKILNNHQLRDQVVELLTLSLGDGDYGIGDWLRKPLLLLAQHSGTFVIRRQRNEFTNKILAIPGDILLYQTRGEEIRQLIQKTIEEAEPPVVLLTHSLGGVASIDLLIKQHLTKVALLVTVGSQAPILYEINSLHSLQHGKPLPKHFPKWLNIYDMRDFLSYVGAKVFPSKVKDVEVNNKQPFPRSHDAYWENQETWKAIIEELP